MADRSQLSARNGAFGLNRVGTPLGIAVVLGALAIALAPAHAYAATQARALFLDESVRPDSVRGELAGPVQPNAMVAQPGEEEGFQIAIRTDAAAALTATVDSSSSPFLQQWTQILRGGYVTTARPSSGTGSAPGAYLDPLPPQVPSAGAAGTLVTQAGTWSAFVVLVSVPAAQPQGTQQGVIAIRDEQGSVIATVDYSITVVTTYDANGQPDPAITPRDPRNFKLLFNFNPNWYRSLAGADDVQAQYEQTYRTVWMLARHRAAPNVLNRAYPTGTGAYDCAAAGGYLKTYDQMPWWADGKPGALPVMLLPNHTVARCTSDGFTIKADKSAATKADDTVGDVTKSAWFIYNVAKFWRDNGVQDNRTYFLNPFDEPTPQQAQSSVATVDKLVHDYAPGVKVLGTTWPMQHGSRRVCGRRACVRVPGQAGSNVNLRDGVGGDDLDGWIAPYFRMYGFATSAAQRRAGVSRAREVLDRLQRLQRRGGEWWTYDLPVVSRRIPQLAVDSPAVDARVMFWALGREGANGWFTATSNRWIDPVNPARPRNPWDDPLSWVGPKAGTHDHGPQGAVSNGWGSLYYPPLRPQLGLTDPLAQPVSSLRLERMRDGVEDANLMRQYRDRFGQAALNRALSGVLGPLTSASDLPAHEAFPAITRPGLALRMEIARRQLLAELAQ